MANYTINQIKLPNGDLCYVVPEKLKSSLVSNVDANTLKNSGAEISYYYATGSSGSTNLPFSSDSAFSLYTYPTGTTNRAQECTAVISGNGHHYIRWSTSSGWTNWYEYLLSNQGMMNTTVLSGGTVTAAVTSSPYKPITWTFNLDSNLTIKNGTTIFIKTPSDGHTNGIFLSLDGGTTYYPICTRKTARLTTEFYSGTLLMLVFDSSGGASSIYPLEGGTARVTVTGGVWNILNYRDDNTFTSSLCTTAAATAAKTAASSNFVLKANTYIYLVTYYANTAQSALTLNINSTGAKPVWINGVISSSTNYTWPAGSYLIYYDGTNYYVNTDGTLFGAPSIALGKSVPEMPFTDFDDIAIPSTYRIKNSATLKTITNSPLGENSDSGGRVITMGGYTTTADTYLRQFFFSSYYRMWIRGQTGTGENLEWSPWRLVVTAQAGGNVGDINTPIYINNNGATLPATNVYNKNNIIYSSTAPANPTDGMIWLKSIPSSDGVMVVRATSHYDSENDTTYYTADKSFEDVASFVENGGIPILIDDYGGVAQCTEISHGSLGDIGDIYFQHIYIEEDTIASRQYIYYANPLGQIQNFIGYSEVEYSGPGGGEDPIS